MNLNFCTVDGRTFEYEAQSDAAVEDLCAELMELPELEGVDDILLVYNSQILADLSSIEDLGLPPNAKIMVVPQIDPVFGPIDVYNSPGMKEPVRRAADPSPPPKQKKQLVIPPLDRSKFPRNMDKLVAILMDTGFSVEDSERALFENNYNVDHAANWLLTGGMERFLAALEKDLNEEHPQIDSRVLGDLQGLFDSLTPDQKNFVEEMIQFGNTPREAMDMLGIIIPPERS